MFARLNDAPLSDQTEEDKSVACLTPADIKQSLDTYLAIKKKESGLFPSYSEPYKKLASLYKTMDSTAEAMSEAAFEVVFQTVSTIAGGSKTQRGFQGLIDKLNDIAGYDWYQYEKLNEAPSQQKRVAFIIMMMTSYGKLHHNQIKKLCASAYAANLVPADVQEAIRNLRLIFATSLANARYILAFLKMLKDHELVIEHEAIATLVSHINKESLGLILPLDAKQQLTGFTQAAFLELVMRVDVALKAGLPLNVEALAATLKPELPVSAPRPTTTAVVPRRF
jgi:hypothetical protein